MKALVCTAPEVLELREVPAPVPGKGEALLRVERVGICGSDMHAFLGHDERRPAPVILGHEAAGTVVEGAHIGCRVIVNPLVICGSCESCCSGRDNLCPDRQIISMPPRAGAFAEYLTMPEENLIDIPDEVSVEQAVAAEPMACGWHAVRLAEEKSAKKVASARCLVVGAGAIGLFSALILRMRGAAEIRVAETNLLRRSFLSTAGLPMFDPAASSSPAGGADIVIDAVGNAASRSLSCAAACPSGIIVHIGLGSADGGLDARRMTLQEISFVGSYAYTAADFQQAARAIFDGRLAVTDWIEERPLHNGAAAFADIRNGKVRAAKIILAP